jgi:SAM-dependent methyltransferase
MPSTNPFVSKLFRHAIGTARSLAKAYGLGWRRTWVAVANTPRFLRDVARYRRLQNATASEAVRRFPLRLRSLWPQLTDFTDQAGVLGGSYFFQDLWAARKIYERRPAAHVDVGSRIDGFISHLLVFMEVTLVDIRHLNTGINGLNFVQGDASSLDVFEDDSQDSLSSLHAAEHFGLGRYGDPIDPEACFRFMKSLQRVLKPGGRLYFSVPIGRDGLQFNALRIFSPTTVMETFDALTLVSFAAVDGNRAFVDPADPADFGEAQHGFGFFEFTKA